MIELGRIPLSHDRSVYDARNKIRVLADALGFDSIQTTRLATAISTAARALATENGSAGIHVALATEHAPPQLILELEGSGGAQSLNGLSAFFDQLTVPAAGAENGRLRAFKGSQKYTIPPGVDLKKYPSVVIWCAQFGVLISPATLKFQ